MPRRNQDASAPALRPTDLFVLAILVDGPQHGYALAHLIAERSRGLVQVRPGDLYRVLYRMEESGLVEPVPPAARPDENPRRTSYRITAPGRKAAREQAEVLTALCAPMLAPRRTEGGR